MRRVGSTRSFFRMDTQIDSRTVSTGMQHINSLRYYVYKTYVRNLT